jgi:hypothetical protein
MKLIRFESERASAVSWRGLGEKMVLTGGVHLSVERERERGEREGGAGLLLGLGPRVWPSWAGALLFSFFLCCFFSYFQFSISFTDFAY